MLRRVLSGIKGWVSDLAGRDHVGQGYERDAQFPWLFPELFLAQETGHGILILKEKACRPAVPLLKGVFLTSLDDLPGGLLVAVNDCEHS